MRQLNFPIVTMLMLSAFSMACNKQQAEINDTESGEVELTAFVKVGAADSKSSVALTKTQEETVSNYQVFIFNSDGGLDVAGYSDGSDAIKLKCSSGSKKIYALVNHSTNITNSTIKTENDLKAVKTELSDNRASGKFVMYGFIQKTISTSTSIGISVDRICSKVYIDKINNKLSGAYGKITIHGIYLTNVAGEAVFGNDSYCPAANGKWYNKKGYVSSDASVNALLADASLSATILKSASYSTAHYFYPYPNSSVSTVSAGEWSPRCSRLVIETSIEGDSQQRRYYVLNLVDDQGAGLQRNNYYHIRELTILRPGSTDPDTPVSTYEATFSITVKEWSKGFDKEEVQF